MLGNSSKPDNSDQPSTPTNPDKPSTPAKPDKLNGYFLMVLVLLVVMEQ